MKKNSERKILKNLTILQIGVLVLGIIALVWNLGIVSSAPPELDSPGFAGNPTSDSASNGAKQATKETKNNEKDSGKEKKLNLFQQILGEARAKNLGTIFGNAGVAGLIYSGVSLFGPFVTNDKEAIDAASWAVSIGYMAGSSIDDVVGVFSPNAGAKIGDFLGGKVFGPITGAHVLAVAVAATYFLSSYKKTKEIKVEYTCGVWDAPTGGEYCENCNEGILPCTEYQCKSLGQACELLNKGTTEEKCAWVNPDDVNPPVIKPLSDALLNEDYSYTPDNQISPPDRGVYIKYNGGCIPAFTPFNFGIILDEPAKCKIDPVRKETFEEMNIYFGGSSTLKYNHTQTLSLPSPDSLASENITIENGGNFELYVRCQDANGNPKSDSPSASFVFKYCVDDGPDTTAPVIESTSVLSGEPVAYNQSKLDLEIYVNEPAECKWNHDRDTSFENMGGDFVCSTNALETNAQMLYTCKGTLNGIRDKVENKFYFRCKDKPYETQNINENSQGYEFVVYGSRPLLIDSAKPNGTTEKDSTETVRVTLEVKTSAGYKDGNSLCWYSESCVKESGREDFWLDNIGKGGTAYEYNHVEDVFLTPGEYDCKIKCVDRGGNSDTTGISYKVETDEVAPVVVRAYHDENYLKIATQEKAGCVYSISQCDYTFEEGVDMNTIDSIEHYTNWDPDKTYYIKCMDKYGNEPLPSVCSIIVRPTKDFS